MTAFADSLVWCVLQITLVGLLAWILCAVIRRWLTAGNPALPAAALAAVVVLTITAFGPWPDWWRFEFSPAREARAAASDRGNLARSERDAISPDVAAPAEVGDAEAPSATQPEARMAGRPEAPRPDAVSDVPAQSSFAIPLTLPAWVGSGLAVLVAAGVLVGLLRLAGGLWSVRACCRASRRVDDASLGELLDVLRAELGLTRRVELRECPHLTTAATIGWMRPVVLLPPAWRDWTADQRRAVLAHELAHVASGDFALCLLAQLGLAIHFYHPLVHWLVGRLRLEQELVADATAAAVAGGRRVYLTTLAELALHSQERSLGWPAHTFLPTPGTFLRRIEMLRDSKTSAAASPRRGWSVKWMAVGLLLAGAAVIAGLRGGPAVSPFDREAAAQGQPASSAPAAGIDLTYVTNDARVLVAIRPAEALAQEEVKNILDKAAGEATPSGTAASPVLKLLTTPHLQQITIIGPAGIDLNRPEDEMVAVLQFTQPTSTDDLAKAGALPWKSKPLAQATGGEIAHDSPNEKTLVVAMQGALRKYLANRRKGKPAIASGEAWQKVQKGTIVAALDMQAIRDRMQEHQPQPNVAAQFDALSPLWRDSEYIAAGIILEGKAVHFRAVATCDNADLAGDVADTAQAAVTLARNSLRSIREREQSPPAIALLALQTAEGLLKTMKIERTEALVVAQTSTTVPQVKTVAEGGLVGAVSQARTAARREVSMNNLKQIMLAMHNYADQHGGRFPPPVVYGKDGTGKVPHSWRVELLRYLDQAALYAAYNFEESWDSEANKKVLAQMPPFFHHPLDDQDSTSSGYFVLVPEKLEGDASERALPTAFAKRDGVRFAEIHDGTSNTLAVVEARRDIPWTRPDDIVYDPDKAPPKLGGFFKEGFNVGLCDGSVRFISGKIEPATLKILISPQAGEPVPAIP
jgi:beta-lactamase regulating signal transducer with metallopeptidase domain